MASTFKAVKPNKGLFAINYGDFNEKFRKIVVEAIPAAAGVGLYRGGESLLNDAIKKPPRAPHDDGNLWGSRRVDKPGINAFGIMVRAGFDIAYAAYQHEGIRADGTHKVNPANYTMEGSGVKFLSSKLAMFGQRYARVVANTILAASKGAKP